MAGKRSTKLKAINVAYKAQNKAEKNKQRKIARHKVKHPNDRQEVGVVPNYKRKAL